MKNMSFQVKEFMWQRLSLGGAELLIYAIIHSFSEGEGKGFFGSQEFLARIAGVSISTVKRAIARLLESGNIEKLAVGNKPCYRCRAINENDEYDNSAKPIGEAGGGCFSAVRVFKERGINATSILSRGAPRAKNEFIPIGNEGLISMTDAQYRSLLCLIDEETLSAYIRKAELLIKNNGYKINNPYKMLRKWIVKDTAV